MWSVTDAKKVRLLLDHGADVNVAARSGRTALIIAAFANPSADVVRMLLAKGAKVAVMDQRKVTPLNAATFGNDTATIRLLLDASADVNTADTFIGLTPLINASGNRNLEAVKLLLAKGANVNAVSKTQDLPGFKPASWSSAAGLPLLMAVPFGPPEIVRTLIDAGAKVNVQDYRGFTPLMLAVATDRSQSGHRAPAARSQRGHADERRARRNRVGLGVEIRRRGGDSGAGRQPEAAVTECSASAELPDVRTAVQRSVSLLERATTQFFSRAACVACHEQPAAAFAVGAARAKGIAVDEKAAERAMGAAHPGAERAASSKARLRWAAPTTIYSWLKR